MKTKLTLLLLLVIFASQSFAIGFPHGLAKKKKTEAIENVKKENKLEKKIILLASGVSYVFEKMITFRR